jgi:hypothetical protein
LEISLVATETGHDANIKRQQESLRKQKSDDEVSIVGLLLR